MASPTPEDVLRHTSPSKNFLCPMSANVYGIDFLSFQIKDYDSKRVIFEVNKDASALNGIDLSSLPEEVYRKIKYDFSVDVLRLPNIQTVLEFSNGPKPVEGFRMIERHYFRDQLVKSFDFKFGFIPPRTRNTWDVVYDVPLLEPDMVDEMLANPYETRSDSFYFVGDTLIMHNKAEYRYTENSIEAQGKANAEGSSAAPSASASAGSKAADAGSKSAGTKQQQRGSKFDDSDEDEDEDAGAGSKYSYK